MSRVFDPWARQRRARVLLLVVTVLTHLAAVGCDGLPSATTEASRTPEPLVPTRTPAGGTEGPTHTPTPPRSTPIRSGAASSTATAEAMADVSPARPTSDPSPTGVPGATATAISTKDAAAELALPQGRERFGAGVGLGSIGDYPAEQLNLGWYLNWGVRRAPARPGGAAFWQMVRVSESGYRPDVETIRAAASGNPGSFWIVGNEPDVRWQDNTTPERYAELYHEVYHELKGADPSCQVVIGGVSQPTPLRLAYLERILSSYRKRYGEPMPVDVWNVHAFILREERDSWGVDIPPGMAVDSGTLYEVDDHDDLDVFRSQIVGFRRWMADHGQRDKPLVVSEYGILMPSDYGFDQQRVRTFMEGSFDIFLNATDTRSGYPPDGNRLVQWWCWYSMAAGEDYYPTGNLVDPTTGTLTPLGEAFAAYSVP